MSPADSTDREPLEPIMAAVARGDVDALAQLFDLTASLVYGIALAITRIPADAEEVVSNVYQQVWKNAAGYKPGRGSVEAWLTMLARSRSLDRLRSMKTRSEREQACAELADPSDLVMSETSLVQLAGPDTPLHRALMALPAERRQVIALVYLRGLTHSEIVTHTGLPLGTVKSHISRGLAQLRELLSA